MRHLQLQAENSQSTSAHMAAGARKGIEGLSHPREVSGDKENKHPCLLPPQSSRFVRVPLLSAAEEWTMDQLLKTTLEKDYQPYNPVEETVLY